MNSINSKEDNRIAHKLMLDGRKHLEINGVREVISFDELGVNLRTALGELNVEGRELTVTTLDTERGVVVVDGNENYKAGVIAPIVFEGDSIGTVMIISSDEKNSLGDVESKLAEVAAGFLGKHMEQ